MTTVENSVQIGNKVELLWKNLLVSPSLGHPLGHLGLKLSQLTCHLGVGSPVPELHLGENLLSKHHKGLHGVACHL